jgi:hypothetical protein
MKKSKLILILLITINNPFYITNNIYSQNQNLSDSQKIVEKVYLNTDRDYYSPGDDIWFKAYLIDASEMLLSNHSNNLHVELISPDSKIVDSRIIKLDEGLGNGDFQLSGNLQSGLYRLRAYTNYMRNFGDQLFFMKDITIINSSDTNDELFDRTRYITNKIEINFFAESGSLVDNVTSLVAFKAVDGEGEGCDVWGEVYSSGGDLVTSFRSIHRGMGTFSLKPVTGLNYYAIVKNQDSDIIKTEIPKSFPAGITLSVILNEENRHIVTIATNFTTLPLIIDKDMFLTISAHNTILKSLNFKLKSTINRFILPEYDLPDGLVMLTLFDQDSLPRCERLIYIQNNEDIRVNIETDKVLYKQRDSISVRISLSKASGIWQEAFLSFSATEKIYTNDSPNFSSTITSWFLLESDVRGQVEEPSYYFDPSNPERLKDLDLLLCTQGWRDFEWKYQDTLYLPETGFKISGRIRRLLIDIPFDEAKVNICILQNENKIISSIPVDSSGRFGLELVDLNGSARLIASATGNRGNLQGLLLLDSMEYSPAKVSAGTLGTNLYLKENFHNNNLTELKQSYEIKNTIREKYTLSDTILLSEVIIATKKKEDPQTNQISNSRMLYGSPDNEILITTQMESYPEIRYLLMGKIAGLYFTTPVSPSDSGIRIRGIGSFSGSEPVFMLDGMIVSYEMIKAIPISWIDRIDVLKSGKASALGVRGANGAISIITKTGESVPYKPVLHSVNIKISGYSKPRIFYSPNHSSDDKSIYNPDLRTTLFWEPNIIIRNNEDSFLNYFNSDNLSTIKINVEGITNTGIPFAGTKEYEVK